MREVPQALLDIEVSAGTSRLVRQVQEEGEEDLVEDSVFERPQRSRSGQNILLFVVIVIIIVITIIIIVITIIITIVKIIILIPPVRVSQSDTPAHGQFQDLNTRQMTGVVRRLEGRGITPVESSTPAEGAAGSLPPHPDTSAVLPPQARLEFRSVSCQPVNEF